MTSALLTRARPILFIGPMIRALLDGRKTQTRRIVKGEIATRDNGTPTLNGQPLVECPAVLAQCPYGKPGDYLWVRETWSRAKLLASYELFYRADGEGQYGRQLGLSYVERERRWRSSIHMPRWVSRLTLRIKSVRVERLQEISEADAEAEGAHDWCGKQSPWVGHLAPAFVHGYASLWESINGPGSWGANPWVWVVEFDVIHTNIDEVLRE